MKTGIFIDMRNYSHPIILALVTLGAIMSTLTFALELKEGAYESSKVLSGSPTNTWKTFHETVASNNGSYSFSYPDGYSVSVDKIATEHRVTLFPSTNDQIPSMTIVVTNTQDDASVTFSLWEGYAWEYYDEVISSFEISN